MTTTEIENLADSDGMATQDLKGNLGRILRRLVIPEFLRDVDRQIGRVHWRRKTTTFSVVVGTRNYDCPTDFDKFELLQRLRGTELGPTLEYIGEESDLVNAAEAATIAAAPSGYYIVPGATNQFAIRLSAPPDANHTLYGVYTKMLYWANDNAAVNLDSLIPWQYQGGLVKKLRMYIVKDRMGIKDNRYAIEKGEYDEWISGLEYAKEAGPRQRVVMVR